MHSKKWVNMRFNMDSCVHENKHVVWVTLLGLFFMCMLLLRANVGNTANIWKKT